MQIAFFPKHFNFFAGKTKSDKKSKNRLTNRALYVKLQNGT